MLKNKNLVLFDDSISHINTSSNDSNIVHKRAVTSIISNDSKITLKVKNRNNVTTSRVLCKTGI